MGGLDGEGAKREPWAIYIGCGLNDLGNIRLGTLVHNSTMIGRVLGGE